MPPASQQMYSRIVQSRQNRRVKELRAGFSPGNRSGTGSVAVEGEHLLAEAVRSDIRIATVFIRTGAEALLDRLRLPSGVEMIELPPAIFASAVTTESPQGIAALVEPRAFTLKDMVRTETPLIVVAAGMQDPGNLGTLVRSAEAFGATGVVTLPGTVSLWNAKALRASSGSAFRLPVVGATEDEVLSFLRTSAVSIFAADADEGVAAAATNLVAASAIFIGNEGSGLSRSILDRADQRITIPCPGPVESLNAAVAASVLLYEASRQRSRPTNASKELAVSKGKQ